MINSVQLNKEILVTLQNKATKLAGLSKAIIDHGITVEAITGNVEEETDQVKVRLITDQDTIACDTLKKNNFENISEKNVLVVTLEDKPGALNVLTKKIADEDIDIKHIYATTCSAGACSSCKIVVDTSDNQKALVALTP